MGNWIDTRGTAERQIEEIERKAEGMIRELKRMTKDCELGRCTTEARAILYEKTVVPSITFNMEMWTKLREVDVKRIERVQAKSLRAMFNLPVSTPYWGLLGELGIWPLEAKVHYHRLMFMHNVLNSDGERLGRKIIKGQMEIAGENWTTETRKIAEMYGMDKVNAERTSKGEWKRKLKEEIQKRVEKRWQEKVKTMTKLRHLKGKKFGKSKYVLDATTEEASEFMKIRLEMKDIGKNYGKDRKCICNEDETIEHIIKCKEVNGTEGWIEIEDINEERKKLEKMRRWLEENNLVFNK